jgi:hypothetical protein
MVWREAERHLLHHTCRRPPAGVLHFLYAFEQKPSRGFFYGKARPVEGIRQNVRSRAPGEARCPISTGGGVILIDIDGPPVMAPAVMYKPTYHFIIDGETELRPTH